METNTAARTRDDSLAEVVQRIQRCVIKGKPLAPFVDLIWIKLYDAVPKLDYTATAVSEDGSREIKGNPDIGKALYSLFKSAGMKESDALLRFVNPAFWALRSLRVVIPVHMREAIGNNFYLWNFDRERHQNFRIDYLSAVHEYRKSLLTNLEAALGVKQNL
jgi:hypothetical protein